MIKVILLPLGLAMSYQAIAYQHPKQDQCDYLAQNISNLHTMNSLRPRFIEELQDLQEEFQLRLCPAVAGYLVSGLGDVARSGFEKPDLKKTQIRISSDAYKTDPLLKKP